MQPTVFIAWSGRLGLAVAEALRETICGYPGLETFLSDDIKTGADWFADIKEKLGKVEHGIRIA